MSMLLSRIMSAGTAAYAVYALVRPRHLGTALSEERQRQESYDLVATIFGCRDLPISVVGMLGRSEHSVRAAMLVRIVLDLTDSAVLAERAETPERSAKVRAVTVGWAALNTLAVIVDSRRTRR